MSNGNLARKEPSAEYLAAIGESNQKSVQPEGQNEGPEATKSSSVSRGIPPIWIVAPTYVFFMFVMYQAAPELQGSLAKSMKVATVNGWFQEIFEIALIPLGLFPESGFDRSGIASLLWGLAPYGGTFLAYQVAKRERVIAGIFIYVSTPIAYAIALGTYLAVPGILIAPLLAVVLAALASFALALAGAGAAADEAKKQMGIPTSGEIRRKQEQDWKRRFKL